jgi:hypothetical protein
MYRPRSSSSARPASGPFLHQCVATSSLIPAIAQAPNFNVDRGLLYPEASQTSLDIQRGFLLGSFHRNVHIVIYILDPGWTDPRIVLGIGPNFERRCLLCESLR